jgi:hypothetical protein
MARLDLEAHVNSHLIRQICEMNKFVESLLQMDVEAIRNEGRCAEALRAIRAQAQELQAVSMRSFLESPTSPDPFAKSGARRDA